MKRRNVLALGSAALLSACGGGGPARVDLPGGPRRFGDRDPVDFPGRGPQGYPVHGIDAARFQGQIDWRAAQGAGVAFAFLKATEGGDRLDPAFQGNWDGAARQGVARGAYHFFYFCTPALVQARWFIANVPKQAGSLPPVLDLEWNPFSPTCTYRPPPETVRAEARIWIDTVARHYGQHPVIYTTPDFWERNDIGRLGEEVWLRAVAKHPTHHYDDTRWTFWQYTSTGQVPGVTGDSDINVFNGSVADWTNWLARRRIR